MEPITQHTGNGTAPPPSLDILAHAASPSEVLSNLSADQLATLAGRCALVQSAIQLAIVSRAVHATTSPAAPIPALTDPPRLFDAREVAARTGFALSYVYELMRTNQLRAVKVGKYRRVTEASLSDWIAKHETPLAASPGRTRGILARSK